MKRPYRPFRTPLARWLACALVTLALLTNGIAMAQAASGGMKDDCCAGMAGQHGDQAPCHQSDSPCQPAGHDCDDQCLARCQASTALASFPMALPGSFQRQPAPQVLIARAFSSSPPDPGLRPPISA